MGNTNRKKANAKQGPVNKKPLFKDAKPVDRTKPFIVWQKDVRVELGQRDAFVQHLVENYYSKSDDFSNRKRTVSEWIDNRISKHCRQDGKGYFFVDIPLLVSANKQEGWEECKIGKRGICYYLPLPPLETDCQQEPLSVDNVFQEGDTIISTLVFSDEEERESSCKFNRAEMDAARDKEKQAFSKLLEDIDVYKTKLHDDSRLRILEDKYSRLEEDKKEIEGKLLSLKQELDNADTNKRKAVLECESKYIQEQNRLNLALKKAEGEAYDYKTKWSNEESKRKNAESIIKEREATISERDETIRRKEFEMKFYKDRTAIFEPVQEFGRRVMFFFDMTDKLQTELSLLKAAPPSGINEDDFNYYIARIEKKYYSVKTNNLLEWRREIQMLSLTGMVPTEGLINSKLGEDEHTGKHKVSKPQWESTLRMLLYQSIMVDLAGAAVTMSDELAYMLPQMVPGVGEKKIFIEISEMLQKAIKDMGYELNYVKPFTQLSQYKDVENVQFTEADVPSGTIFEVLKMALNYGSTKKKTEVSAKQ